MSNVLTPEEKKKLGTRLGARFAIVGSLVLMLGALVASLALAPAFISVTVARAALNAPLSEESADVREDGARAARTQTILEAVEPLIEAPTLSVRLAQAFALAPAGISITSVSYRSGSTELSGISSGREALNEFRLAVEESGLFSSVNVPVTALVGTQSGRFTMSLVEEE